MPTNIRTCPIHGSYSTACGCTDEQMDAALRSALPPKGGLDILNTGAGHIEIRFDNKPEEIDRAKKIIEDMLRRGYSLFVEGEDRKLVRVESFDAGRGLYIVENTDPVMAKDEEAKKRGRPKKALKMAETKVTAIGRTAGG